MNDTDRISTLIDLARSTVRIAHQAGLVSHLDGLTPLDRMRLRRPGLKATRYDSDRVGGFGVSDPTSSTALQQRRSDDPEHLEELDRLIREIRQRNDRIFTLLAGYSEPRRANDADRLALARENTRPDPGCDSCARIESDNILGEPWFVDVDPDHAEPTACPSRSDGVDRLGEPMHLCRWCYDFVGSWWRLPYESELSRRQRGERLRIAADEPKKAEARRQARIAEWLAQQAALAEGINGVA